MAKRFTDTDKYKKPFIRSLPGEYKLLWDYLYHDCDHAGIWIADFEIAQIYIGSDMQINKEKALSLFNDSEVRIIEFDGGKKWLILPFIDFQYGELNDTNRVHKSVLNELKKYDLYEKYIEKNKPLISPLQRAKDKDKDKDKEKDEYELQKIPPGLEARAFEFFGSVPLGNLREWLSLHSEQDIFEAMRLGEQRGIKTTSYVEGILRNGVKKENGKSKRNSRIDYQEDEEDKYAHLEAEFM